MDESSQSTDAGRTSSHLLAGHNEERPIIPQSQCGRCHYHHHHHHHFAEELHTGLLWGSPQCGTGQATRGLFSSKRSYTLKWFKLNNNDDYDSKTVFWWDLILTTRFVPNVAETTGGRYVIKTILKLLSHEGIEFWDDCTKSWMHNVFTTLVITLSCYGTLDIVGVTIIIIILLLNIQLLHNNFTRNQSTRADKTFASEAQNAYEMKTCTDHNCTERNNHYFCSQMN